jgi:hypothetical protein
MTDESKVSLKRDSLIAFANSASFIWEPTNCSIIKVEKSLFSTTQTRGPEDVFAITNKLYEHEGDILIIRGDCSIERIDQNMKQIFFRTQKIGKFISSDLSVPLKLLALCTDKNIVVVDPYNGQSLSKFSLIKKCPLMIKILETPVIVVAYNDEVIVQRMDFPKDAPENVIRKEKYLCRFKSSERITSICPIDLVGTPSDLLVFTESKTAYLIHPTNYLNDDIIEKNITEVAEASIPVGIVAQNSIYHRKSSVVYASDSSNVVAIYIGASPKKLY